MGELSNAGVSMADIEGLPVEFLQSPEFEEALKLALTIMSGGAIMLGIETWADAEVTKAGT